MDETKECPVCKEEIKAEAKVCRFCNAEFDVARKGYCKECHEMVEAEEGAKCPKCGAELMDLFWHTELKEEATPAPLLLDKGLLR